MPQLHRPLAVVFKSLPPSEHSGHNALLRAQVHSAGCTVCPQLLSQNAAIMLKDRRVWPWLDHLIWPTYFKVYCRDTCLLNCSVLLCFIDLFIFTRKSVGAGDRIQDHFYDGLRSINPVFLRQRFCYIAWSNYQRDKDWKKGDKAC